MSYLSSPLNQNELYQLFEIVSISRASEATRRVSPPKHFTHVLVFSLMLETSNARLQKGLQFFQSLLETEGQPTFEMLQASFNRPNLDILATILPKIDPTVSKIDSINNRLRTFGEICHKIGLHESRVFTQTDIDSNNWTKIIETFFYLSLLLENVDTLDIKRKRHEPETNEGPPKKKLKVEEVEPKVDPKELKKQFQEFVIKDAKTDRTAKEEKRKKMEGKYGRIDYEQCVKNKP